MDSLPLFQTPVREMARRSDPDSSKRAALAISETLSTLQQRVFEAVQRHGRLTAKEAEDLEEFADLGFSTVRKRIVELHQRNWLSTTGVIRGGCREYQIVKLKDE